MSIMILLFLNPKCQAFYPSLHHVKTLVVLLSLAQVIFHVIVPGEEMGFDVKILDFSK